MEKNKKLFLNSSILKCIGFSIVFLILFSFFNIFSLGYLFLSAMDGPGIFETAVKVYFSLYPLVCLMLLVLPLKIFKIAQNKSEFNLKKHIFVFTLILIMTGIILFIDGIEAALSFTLLILSAYLISILYLLIISFIGGKIINLKVKYIFLSILLYLLNISFFTYIPAVLVFINKWYMILALILLKNFGYSAFIKFIKMQKESVKYEKLFIILISIIETIGITMLTNVITELDIRLYLISGAITLIELIVSFIVLGFVKKFTQK